jgi:hypothetical protein
MLGAAGETQVVERLPSKHEVLSSNASTTQKQKKAFYFDVIHFLYFCLFLAFLGSYPKFHCPYWYLEISPMFSSSFIVSTCTSAL